MFLLDLPDIVCPEDPAVYTSFDIYPAVLTVLGSEEMRVSTCTLPTCMWPLISLYSVLDTSGYPHLVIYPALSLGSVGTTTSNATISVRLEAEYPVFNICMCHRPTLSTDTDFYHRQTLLSIPTALTKSTRQPPCHLWSTM